jgi:hypothetical protein
MGKLARFRSYLIVAVRQSALVNLQHRKGEHINGSPLNNTALIPQNNSVILPKTEEIAERAQLIFQCHAVRGSRWVPACCIPTGKAISIKNPKGNNIDTEMPGGQRLLLWDSD